MNINQFQEFVENFGLPYFNEQLPYMVIRDAVQDIHTYGIPDLMSKISRGKHVSQHTVFIVGQIVAYATALGVSTDRIVSWLDIYLSKG